MKTRLLVALIAMLHSSLLGKVSWVTEGNYRVENVSAEKIVELGGKIEMRKDGNQTRFMVYWKPKKSFGLHNTPAIHLVKIDSSNQTVMFRSKYTAYRDDTLFAHFVIRNDNLSNMKLVFKFGEVHYRLDIESFTKAAKKK